MSQHPKYPLAGRARHQSRARNAHFSVQLNSPVRRVAKHRDKGRRLVQSEPVGESHSTPRSCFSLRASPRPSGRYFDRAHALRLLSWSRMRSKDASTLRPAEMQTFSKSRRSGKITRYSPISSILPAREISVRAHRTPTPAAIATASITKPNWVDGNNNFATKNTTQGRTKTVQIREKT